MASLRKSCAKAFQVCRNYTCTITWRSQNHNSNTSLRLPSIAPRFTPHFGFRSPSLWGCGIGSRRFYYVDRYNVEHFRKRGPRRWFENPRMVFIVVVTSGGALATIYFGNNETVPYSNRKHFVLLSKEMERKLGEAEFEKIKESFKGKILPTFHPESIRVKLISQRIIDSLQRGLKNERVWSDLEYANPNPVTAHGERSLETLRLLSGDEETHRHFPEENTWQKDGEILDDNWVQKSRKKGIERGAKAEMTHVQSFKWEVLVVDEPVVNAFCLPGGKIVVFTGLLKDFRSDPEVAAIIGHEVGHVVARHSAEGITKNMWFAILQIVLYQFIMPDVANVMSTLLLRLPFSRKMEMEADYIGVLLMASAGYDPRTAPKVFEKLGKLIGDSAIQDYISTHPSGKKRAELLANAQVMEEALSLYRESIAGKGIEGFL